MRGESKFHPLFARSLTTRWTTISLISLGFITYWLWLFYSFSVLSNSLSDGKEASQSQSENLSLLLNLVRQQNNTLDTLRNRFLKHQHDEEDASGSSVSGLSRNPLHCKLMSRSEKECEARYGIALADLWRDSEQIWCEELPESKVRHPSSLKCYPYMQEHCKVLDFNKEDIFCVAENFVMDFSKVNL